ncbi:hypothetical protein ES705_37196 [subsurface metagenome]
MNVAKRKYKKPIHCPVCKKTFSYKAKSAPIGRLSKHIKLKHPKFKRKKAKKKTQLMSEFEYTDDMIIKSLLSAGIPLKAPSTPLPQETIEHESIVGAILTGIKIGRAIATGVKVAKAVKKRKRK